MTHPPHRRPATRQPWLRCARAWLCVLAALGGAGLVQAQAQPQADSAAGLEQLARDFLQPSLDASLSRSGATALRPEVLIGSLDRRLRLAPCARIEPHLPPGMRLWGRSRIGLRCVDGPTRWNVFLPVTVRAWGPAWVLKRPVAAGETLTQDAAELSEIDWAEQNAQVLANPALWVGQRAAFALQPGMALRQHMVRPQQVFAAGAQVRVSQSGSGFEVTVIGQTLGVGHVGQPVRVRLPNGSVVSGVVRDGQSVELSL
ncbi:flagellar basal body P-ring formation chaperone FlgA [Hydrogenophaga sp.]|uniref:flagellar basal body P-ring formation chaperone FlgA n=1 Tax=Hydrogenophaga sp. TaxID=1904254 RepID=UPI0019CEE689|nr:flagellar basal body P-ring formation chaperone FlgA [Hydrogenophaga sp.]MBD3892596.1 flagellar basal body P-ring formation protein FlgA [Hydrogenophaga sp.]